MAILKSVVRSILQFFPFTRTPIATRDLPEVDPSPTSSDPFDPDETDHGYENKESDKQASDRESLLKGHFSGVDSTPIFLPPIRVNGLEQRQRRRVIVISDTHEYHKDMQIPEGDILIHCGDFGNALKTSEKDTRAFNEWLGTLPHAHKIVVAGNHERHLAKKTEEEICELLSNAVYLQDKSVTVDGIKLHGAPWHRRRGMIYRANAFALPVEEMREKWDLIPDDTDIVITHVPAYGILDHHPIGHVGCPDLLDALARVQPKMHCFGHTHHSHGSVVPRGDDHNHVAINAACHLYVFDVLPVKER